MRQHKILTQTLLILSIINFALTAPVAVRGRPGVRLDANVSGKVTAASQRRQDSLNERGSSTNVPGPDNAPRPTPVWLGYVPPSPGLPEPSPRLPSPFTYSLSHTPPTPDSLRSGSDYVLPSPGLPTGSRLPVGSMPVAGSLSPHPSQPGPSEGHFPSPSGVSVNPYTLSSTGPTGYHPTPPQGPGMDPEMYSQLNPEPFPTEFWGNVFQPTPPQGPEVDPEMHSLL